MKKYIILLLCIILVTSTFSCDSDKEDKHAQNNAAGNEDIIKENDNAMQKYEEAISDEICVFDDRLGEIKLKSLRFSSNDISLDECKLLKSSIFDVDQNGVNEYVIKSNDNSHIILRYHNGKVRSYCLDTCDYYKFNTDGTFYWYDALVSGAWECGLSKIVFDGETLNIISLYSIKYFEDPVNYEYFVEGKTVDEDEYYACIRDHSFKDTAEFSYFELTNLYPITAEQAWNLANAYWDGQDGCRDMGAGTTWTARIVLVDTPCADTNYYRVAFQVEWTSNGGGTGDECKPPYHVSLKDQILVNAFTGEITTPACESGNKCISDEEAIEIVKNNYGDIDFGNEEGKYLAEIDLDITAPEHICVVSIKKLVGNDHNFYTRAWVDKYTGEIVSPYYMYGKG